MFAEFCAEFKYYSIDIVQAGPIMSITIIKTMEFCSSDGFSLERKVNDGPTNKINEFLKKGLYYYLFD